MLFKKFKFFFKLCLACALFLGLQQLIEIKTHGFCLQRIFAEDLPENALWETPPLSLEEEQQLRTLLSQPYTFLGAGSECFAFASQDGSTVIKFFKLDTLRPVFLHRGIFREDHSAYAGALSNRRPSHWVIKKVLGMREYRLLRTFSSLKLAFENLKEETGLVYLHLNPTQGLFPKKLTLLDPCGIAHQVELDTTKFFLQKKATPVEKQLALLKEKQEHEKARRCIDSLLQLIATRCQKGYADRDLIDRNLGFIGTQAIEIDSGSFTPNEIMQHPWVYRHELFYATLELKEWLKANYPEMSHYLEERVSETLHSPVPPRT